MFSKKEPEWHWMPSLEIWVWWVKDLVHVHTYIGQGGFGIINYVILSKKIGKRYNAELSKYNVQCNATFTLAVFYRASTVESTVPARHGTARHCTIMSCLTFDGFWYLPRCHCLQGSNVRHYLEQG